MSTGLILVGVACLLAIGLVVQVGVFSLLSGAFHFLFGKPKLNLLKSSHGNNGFAFSFNWKVGNEPLTFDNISVRLFNPFGKKTQVEVSKDFPGASKSFAKDLDMGIGMSDLVSSIGDEKARVLVEIKSSRDSISHQFDMDAQKFLNDMRNAEVSAESFNEDNKPNTSKALYTIPKKTFISEPLPETNKILKISANPAFVGTLAAAGGAATEVAQENFAVSKVWIEPGCIVCDACEAIYPDVFEVTDSTCLIRPGAPLDNGLLVLEAAEACPVEVIKFTKAG